MLAVFSSSAISMVGHVRSVHFVPQIRQQCSISCTYDSRRAIGMFLEILLIAFVADAAIRATSAPFNGTVIKKPRAVVLQSS